MAEWSHGKGLSSLSQPASAPLHSLIFFLSFYPWLIDWYLLKVQSGWVHNDISIQTHTILWLFPPFNPFLFPIHILGSLFKIQRFTRACFVKLYFNKFENIKNELIHRHMWPNKIKSRKIQTSETDQQATNKADQWHD